MRKTEKMSKKSISTIFDEAPITQANIDTGKLVWVKRVKSFEKKISGASRLTALPDQRKAGNAEM